MKTNYKYNKKFANVLIRKFINGFQLEYKFICIFLNLFH